MVTDGQRLLPPPRAFFRMDGRVKLLLLVIACFIDQYLSTTGLLVWLPVQAALLFAPELRQGQSAVMLRAGLYFIAFWLVMTIGSDVLLGKPAAASAVAALPLALRLFAFTLTGIIFVGMAQPLETGRAVAWFLRPVLGRQAWKPALALALTAWFLPVTLRLSGQVRAGMRARGLSLAWHKKATLLMGTSLRILEDMAAELAVGLASRRLDDYRSWM